MCYGFFEVAWQYTSKEKAIGSNADGLFIIIRALKGGDWAAETQVLLLRCCFFLRIIDNVLAVGLHAVVLFF